MAEVATCSLTPWVNPGGSMSGALRYCGVSDDDGYGPREPNVVARLPTHGGG